jgi:hypothetical protein
VHESGEGRKKGRAEERQCDSAIADKVAAVLVNKRPRGGAVLLLFLFRAAAAVVVVIVVVAVVGLPSR